jgi:uncharacterized protein (DUF58 family)
MGPLATVARRLHETAHYDFCPWANRYVYWLKQPIGWFVVGALASLLLGLFFAPQGYVMLAAILAAMICGVAWPWIGLLGVTCELQFERRRAREGEPVRVAIRVHNRWPWPLMGLAINDGFFLRDRFGETTTAVALASVPGWSRSEFHWEFVPPRRGDYPDQPPRAATGFPFGIWQAHRPVRVVNQLLVWPRIVPLDDVPALGGGQRLVAGVPCDRSGDEGDVIGARPYRLGDSLRHIHWPQTARRGILVVRERQSTSFQVLRLVIDLPVRSPSDAAVGRVEQFPALAGASGDDSCEWLIRVAASICQALHAHGMHIEILCDHLPAGNIVAIPGPTGLRFAMDALARLDVASPPRPVASRAQPSRNDAIEIVVTADVFRAHSAGAYQRIVLVAPDPSFAPAWLAIDLATDPVRQLQHQWARACHDGW